MSTNHTEKKFTGFTTLRNPSYQDVKELADKINGSILYGSERSYQNIVAGGNRGEREMGLIKLRWFYLNQELYVTLIPKEEEKILLTK